MAGCPKCGKAPIKRRNGAMNCRHCGSIRPKTAEEARASVAGYYRIMKEKGE